MKKIILLLCSFLLLPLAIMAQDVTVSGTVIAEDDGLPLPGVAVRVKGSDYGVISDMDGKYSISANKYDVLVFSFIGMKEQEQMIGNQSNINVVLKAEYEMLTEVVAIGYGTVKKSDLTGAVASVKADELQRTPAANIDQALQGKVAGVSVNAGSGQPGAAAEVRIRGIGTVNNSAPIYVVDGVIVDNISFLNPNDIESTEILKDASATAIYGSRGANGVILVSTIKGGKDGKSRISFNTYTGVQNRWRKLDLMKSKEFAETQLAIENVASQKKVYETRGFNEWLDIYKTKSKSSSYFPLVLTSANPDGFDYSKVETDWQDEVFKSNALIQNYHLSVDGGNDKSNYAISGSFFRQEGTIIGSDFERLTLRVNSSHEVKKWLKVGENLTFATSQGRNAMNNHASPGASLLSAALAMAPWDPTHYPAGAINKDGKDLGGQIAASSNFSNVVNPFSMVENTEPMDKSERLLGNMYLEFKFFKGLTLRSDVSLDLTNNRDRMFKYAYEYSSFDASHKNFVSSSMERHATIKYENILTYNINTNKHSLTLMAGTTTEEYNYYSIGGAGASILNPVETNWYLSQATEDRTQSSDGVSRARMQSFLSRAHYGYDDRYLLTLSYRADGTSKFPENTWGYFPSMAFAWRVSEESFLEDAYNLDFLKFRFGWGQIGNEKIGSDSFTLKMHNAGPTFVDYAFGQNSQLANGATILTYTNRGGRWEVTEQIDVGLDFGLFNSKINATIDVFQRDTKDMLLNVQAPAHVGNRYSALSNVGVVQNKGVELSLEHMNTITSGTRPFKYSISANGSVIKNELTKLNGGEKVWGDRTLTDEGLALYTFWGYDYLGIYRSDEEASAALDGISYGAGDAIYRDLDGNRKIDDDDRVKLGNPFPWLNYGFNISADWNNFDLQVFLQGVYGNEIYNALRERTEGDGKNASLLTTMRDVWTPSNLDGTIPNPRNSVNYFTSSRFIEDGSYFRLKNIQIGYTIPKALTERIDIQRFRLYVSANNLFTLTNYSGYDPEVGGGVDYGNYPQSRTIMIGANVNF